MSARAERVITDSDGNETRILYTMRGLGDAEKMIGKPVLGVLTALVENKASIEEVAGLLRAGMESARRDARTMGRVVSLNDAYNLMEVVGFTVVVTAVVEAIAAVISYSQDSPN